LSATTRGDRTRRWATGRPARRTQPLKRRRPPRQGRNSRHEAFEPGGHRYAIPASSQSGRSGLAPAPERCPLGGPGFRKLALRDVCESVSRPEGHRDHPQTKLHSPSLNLADSWPKNRGHLKPQRSSKSATARPPNRAAHGALWSIARPAALGARCDGASGGGKTAVCAATGRPFLG
jgi:hypothetical protein